jgi:hypothetical protein
MCLSTIRRLLWLTSPILNIEGYRDSVESCPIPARRPGIPQLSATMSLTYQAQGTVPTPEPE